MSGDDLIALRKRELPVYKALKTVEFWDALPRSGVGKVLKRKVRGRFCAGHERKIGGERRSTRQRWQFSYIHYVSGMSEEVSPPPAVREPTADSATEESPVDRFDPPQTLRINLFRRTSPSNQPIESPPYHSGLI